ncbi:hypothetical protein BH10PSE15_BH10PSE15_06030 [soil metagenome]
MVRVTRTISVPDGAVSASQPAPAPPTPASVKAAAPTAMVGRDSGIETTQSVLQIRQLVQQITATMAYGANVSVVSSANALHATIDVSV